MLAFVAAGLSQCIILFFRKELISWGYPYEPSWPVTVAPVIAAGAPFLIVMFFFIAREKKEPNQ